MKIPEDIQKIKRKKYVKKKAVNQKWFIAFYEDQLLKYLIQDIVNMISTDQNIEYDEAMNKFYNSEVFEKLIDKETGLYLENPE